MFKGQSHPDVTATGSKGLSAKLLLSQSESLFWNGGERREKKKKTPLVKDRPGCTETSAIRSLCQQKKKIHKLYTVHPPQFMFSLSPPSLYRYPDITTLY